MSWISRVINVFRTSRVDPELDEELRFHIEERTEALMRDGLPRQAAEALALRQLGRPLRIREESRDVKLLPGLDSLAQDLRIAARIIVRNPAFAMVVVLTLALGIGATTTIFAVVNGVLLKPLAYPDADRIVTLWQHSREHGVDDVAPANFVDWRERSRSIELMAAIEPFSVDYMGPDGPERIRTWRVTEGFFEILGISPVLGRTFRQEDYVPGKHHVVVLGHGLWQSRFGGDPHILGRTLDLSGQPTTVVGVMPPGFGFPAGRDSWMVNLVSESQRQNRSSAYLQVIGKLGSTTDLRSAQGELDTIAAQLAREHPRTNATTGIAVVPLAEQLVGHARGPLLVLLAAVAFLLLIACANVANLLLARAVDRECEFATRAALGASGGRVVRQLITESLLLAGLGGTLGLLLATWGLGLMQTASPPGLPRIDAIGMEPRVVAFAVLVSVGTAVLFGLAPALQLARANLHAPLRASGGSAGVGPASRRVRRSLVVAQVALAMVLLIGAGLLMRSFAALVQVNPGYRTDGVLAAVVHAWRHYPSPAERMLFVQQTVEHLASLPGVLAAGVTSSLPLAERISAETATFEIEGQAPAPSGAQPSAHAAAVTSGYFEAMGIALRQGRVFDSRDAADTAPVVVISEAMARRYWPGDEPVGKKLTLAFMGPPLVREVVGIVSDVRHEALDDTPRPTVFLPHAQSPSGSITFVVRTTGDPRLLLGAVRDAIWAVSPTMPIASVTTLDHLRAESLRDRRLTAALLVGFSLMAVALAAIGIFGLLSHETSRRAREIGLRLALGARHRSVLGLIIGDGLRVTIAGTLLGALLALVLTRFLAAWLFGIAATDPLTFVATAGLLTLVALVASYLPAHRATRVDPVTTLRSE